MKVRWWKRNTCARTVRSLSQKYTAGLSGLNCVLKRILCDTLLTHQKQIVNAKKMFCRIARSRSHKETGLAGLDYRYVSKHIETVRFGTIRRGAMRSGAMFLRCTAFQQISVIVSETARAH